MNAQILANIKTNLIFYRRNRLLLAVSIIILIIMALSVIPAFFFLTSTKHLEIVSMIFSSMSKFITIITAGLGLLFISTHIRNRSAKMVFTKPCLPETWLFSNVASASMVCFILYTSAFVISSVLLIVWGIPYKTGLLFMTLSDFFSALIFFSYVSLLAVMFHPATAILFVIFFNESLFFYLKLVLSGGIKAAGDNSILLLKVLKGIVDVVYMIIPTMEPFSKNISDVHESLRISIDDWGYLGMIAIYTVIVSILFYMLSVYFIRKKRII